MGIKKYNAYTHIPENQGKILKILLEYAGTEDRKSTRLNSSH